MLLIQEISTEYPASYINFQFFVGSSIVLYVFGYIHLFSAFYPSADN